MATNKQVSHRTDKSRIHGNQARTIPSIREVHLPSVATSAPSASKPRTWGATLLAIPALAECPIPRQRGVRQCTFLKRGTTKRDAGWLENPRCPQSCKIDWYANHPTLSDSLIPHFKIHHYRRAANGERQTMTTLPQADLAKFENSLTAGKIAAAVVDHVMKLTGDDGQNPLRQPEQRTPNSPCSEHQGFQLLMADVPELRKTLMGLPYRQYTQQHPKLRHQVHAAANDVLANLSPENVQQIADAVPQIREKQRSIP